MPGAGELGIPGPVLLLAAAILVLAVVLEGRRQARRYGRPSGRPNLAGVGMLELQRQLQPDRAVEVLSAQQKKEEAGEVEGDPSGRVSPPSR